MSTNLVKRLSVITCIFWLALFSNPANGTVLITDFGTPQFTVDAGTTDFSNVSQSSSSVTLVGTDTNIFAGFFLPIDITGQTVIQLTAQVSGTNPGSQFQVELFDPTFNFLRRYTGSLSSFSTTPSTTTLTFLNETGSFTEIGGFQYAGSGSGAALNLTLHGISAVPEPSTWVLITIGLFCGLILFRKRSKAFA